MSYDELYAKFVLMFPEYKFEFQRLAKEANADESDGMHIMFSFVVVPFVLNLLQNNKVCQLKKAFDYFENMASSNSADITEVLEFTVIENLMSSSRQIYETARQYMGNKTLECCKNVSQYLNIN